MEMLGKQGKTIIVVGLLIVLVLLIRDFNGRMTELRRLQTDADLVSTQYSQLASTQSALETQVAFAESDEAVKQYLYEQGKYSQPGDVVVVPMPAEGGGPTPTPVLPTPLPIVTKWQLWLSLFVDPTAKK
jgi:hypothetical protein